MKNALRCPSLNETQPSLHFFLRAVALEAALLQQRSDFLFKELHVTRISMQRRSTERGDKTADGETGKHHEFDQR